MFNKLNIFKVCLTIFFALGIAKPCFSSQKLTCATTHFPPYTFYDEPTRTFSGLDIDIIEPLFEKLKIDVEIINLPWARLKFEITKGDYDCYFSLGNIEGRDKFLQFSNWPTHVTTIALFYPKNQVSIDFSKKVVGVHRGINIPKNIPPAYGLQSSTIHKLPSNEVLFKMLQSGRVDAVVTSKTVGEYIVQTMDDNFTVEILDIEGFILPVYLAFKKETIDINIVNKALLEIINSSHPKL